MTHRGREVESRPKAKSAAPMMNRWSEASPWMWHLISLPDSGVTLGGAVAPVMETNLFDFNENKGTDTHT